MAAASDSLVLDFPKPLFLQRAPSATDFREVIDQDNDDRWQIVRQVFTEVIEPIYGNQEAALQKIKHGNDRICQLLYKDEIPVGIIVFKKALSDEFAHLGVHRSLEVKTLCLVNPKQNSGKGYASSLLHKIMNIAEQMLANAIHLTVSEKVKDAFAFFTKKQFKVVASFPGLYEKGVTEHLLVLNFKKAQGSE